MQKKAPTAAWFPPAVGGTAKNKGGRPKKHGRKDLSELFRASLILEGYKAARSAGATHLVAVEAACRHARANLPTMRCSNTTVKTVLAELAPTGQQRVWYSRALTAVEAAEAARQHAALPPEMRLSGQLQFRAMFIEPRPAYTDQRLVRSKNAFRSRRG